MSPKGTHVRGPSSSNFLYTQSNAWKPPTPKKTTRHRSSNTESRIGPCCLWTGDHSAVRLKSASTLLYKKNPELHRAPVGEGIQ
ncbi:hypothetical protein M404DRAFT_803597 [Pisolithus tinctorius Marx 270]|uniref:Uncharacterized protein n=1 Tax=Pisolithus tinctorius Marx 270 TaxID=870435 RepID=A0A0C3PDP1_PISTI|nr:hypothetical protein M404DRAFT_803597 [Pisolithus tinctorius Marx 270]